MIEFDEANQFLLFVTLEYNKRRAHKGLGLNHLELRDKITDELERYKIWDNEGEDHSSQDLAADKRKAIEARLAQEEEGGDPE